jgi:hypothetical protein
LELIACTIAGASFGLWIVTATLFGIPRKLKTKFRYFRALKPLPGREFQLTWLEAKLKFGCWRRFGA